MRIFVMVIGMLITTMARAIDPQTFDSASQEERYRDLIEELRCLQCQNENLADSTAPIAKDLRREVLQMLKSGKDEKEIKSFLTARYGEFVLYRPRHDGAWLLLWLLPMLAGLAAIWAMRNSLSKGKSAANPAPPAAEEDW
jgi:cytochrome c-type biogenesis protein CcmH